LRAAAEDILLLYEEVRGAAFLRPALSLEYLAEVLHPYLRALVDIQHTLDDARGQHRSQVHVNTISASRPDSPIGIGLHGVSDAVWVAREWILPWRRDKAGLLAGPILSGAEPSTGERTGTGRLSAATRFIQESQLPRDDVPLPADLRAAIHELAARILEQFLPNLADPDREKHMSSLLAPLTILATSRLQIYVGGASPAGG
jgi:hypothetical protein